MNASRISTTFFRLIKHQEKECEQCFIIMQEVLPFNDSLYRQWLRWEMVNRTVNGTMERAKRGLRDRALEDVLRSNRGQKKGTNIGLKIIAKRNYHREQEQVRNAIDAPRSVINDYRTCYTDEEGFIIRQPLGKTNWTNCYQAKMCNNEDICHDLL